MRNSASTPRLKHIQCMPGQVGQRIPTWDRNEDRAGTMRACVCGDSRNRKSDSGAEPLIHIPRSDFDIQVDSIAEPSDRLSPLIGLTKYSSSGPVPGPRAPVEVPKCGARPRTQRPGNGCLMSRLGQLWWTL